MTQPGTFFTRRQAMAAGLAALGSGALGASAGSPRALAQAPAIVKLPRKITIKAATIVAALGLPALTAYCPPLS